VTYTFGMGVVTSMINHGAEGNAQDAEWNVRDAEWNAHGAGRYFHDVEWNVRVLIGMMNGMSIVLNGMPRVLMECPGC
jgi:hypothetical protein